MTEQKNRTEKELNYYLLFENYTHGRGAPDGRALSLKVVQVHQQHERP